MAKSKKAHSTNVAKQPRKKQPAAKKHAAGDNYSESHGCRVVIHKKDESSTDTAE